jgi:hypothetical protein
MMPLDAHEALRSWFVSELIEELKIDLRVDKCLAAAGAGALHAHTLHRKHLESQFLLIKLGNSFRKP